MTQAHPTTRQRAGWAPALHPLCLEVVLNNPGEDIIPRPDTRDGEEARVDGSLGEEHGGHAPDAEDAAHVLRVGHDGEGEALVPGDGPPEAHAVVDALLTYGARGSCWKRRGGGMRPNALPQQTIGRINGLT